MSNFSPISPVLQGIRIQKEAEPDPSATVPPLPATVASLKVSEGHLPGDVDTSTESGAQDSSNGAMPGQPELPVSEDVAKAVAEYAPRSHNKPLHNRHPQVVLQNRVNRIRELWDKVRDFTTVHGPEAQEAWNELARMFAPVKVNVADVELPAIGCNDSEDTKVGVVVNRLPDRRRVLIRFPQGTVDRMLWLPYGSPKFKEGDKVWCRPTNAPDSAPGFQLVGEYNIRCQRIG